MKTQRVYFASPWFNDAQVAMMQEGKNKLENNPTIDWFNSYVPLDHQYKGLDVEHHPELMNDVEWQQGTYLGDISGIIGTDLVVALVDPDNMDEGVAFEMGYAMANNKPVVVVLPDVDDPACLNLMVAKGCTQVITMSEVSSFNFNQVPAKPYLGRVF